jgi:hypothetical protein
MNFTPENKTMTATEPTPAASGAIELSACQEGDSPIFAEAPAANAHAEHSAKTGTVPAPLDVLQEYSDNRGVALRVDRQRGLIQGVKLLGTVSKKGREYPSAVSGVAENRRLVCELGAHTRRREKKRLQSQNYRVQTANCGALTALA